MRKLLSRLGVVLLVAAAPVGVYLAPEPSPYPSHWDPRVLPIVHFVEDERGLTFEHPVAVEFLDDKAFRAKMASPAADAQTQAASRRFLEASRALGLITGAPDLHQAESDFAQSDVVGVYVDDEKTLYVRGTELTPYVRGTLAHELTHALQDQRFDLASVFATKGADDNAVRSLVEGDAMRVEAAYQAAMSKDDKRLYAQEEQAVGAGADPPGVPALLKHLDVFPYVFGPAYLDALLAEGGNGAVDAAFRHPPVVDAQVLDPTGYPGSWHPVDVPAPALPQGAKALDAASPFGKVVLTALVADASGYPAAVDDLAGWQGDTWQPYREDGTTCVALDVATTGAATAQQLAEGLRGWAKAMPHADVTTDGSRVHVRSCDPGASFQLRTAAPDPFDVLSARAEALHELMYDGGWPVDRAQCVVDGVITALGPAGMLAVDRDPALLPRAREAFRSAAESC